MFKCCWSHFLWCFSRGTPLKGSSSGTGDRQSASFQSKHIIIPRTAIIISGTWRNRSKREPGRYTVAEVTQKVMHLIFVFCSQIKLRLCSVNSKKEARLVEKQTNSACCGRFGAVAVLHQCRHWIFETRLCTHTLHAHLHPRTAEPHGNSGWFQGQYMEFPSGLLFYPASQQNNFNAVS